MTYMSTPLNYSEIDNLDLLRKKKQSLSQKAKEWGKKGKDNASVLAEIEIVTKRIEEIKNDIKQRKEDAKKSRTQKLKEAAQERLKKKQEKQDKSKNRWAEIGIPDYSGKQKKSWWCYKIQYLVRAKMDRTKFPFEKTYTLDELYPDRTTADKAAKKLEKLHPENMYYSHPVIEDEEKIPSKILKKVLTNGWNEHRAKYMKLDKIPIEQDKL